MIDYDRHQNNSDKHYETIDIPEDRDENKATTDEHGYETLTNHQQHHYHHQHSLILLNKDIDHLKEQQSQYEPNYEMVKSSNESNHSAGASDDGYAKVLEKKPNSLDQVLGDDGYTKVKDKDTELNIKVMKDNDSNKLQNSNQKQRVVDEIGEDGAMAGYSTIEDVKDCRSGSNNAVYHNYASILETKQENDSLDTDSDHYARISERLEETPNTSTHCIELTLSSSSKSMPDELLTPPIIDFSVASPISLTSNSFLINTSSSVNSSTNITTSATTSSRQTPSSSSQYESLTGSETDPNYESVCYLTNSTAPENPYERLHTDFSDTQLSSSSPQSIEISVRSSIEENSSSITVSSEEQQQRPHLQLQFSNNNNISNSHQKIKLQKSLSDNNSANNADILVNDYFHV